jgi:hypothetical protein
MDAAVRKSPEPALEHWEQATLAARSAWKRWRHSYSHIHEDDIVPELMLDCMEQYDKWDPLICPWFGWCCYITKKRIHSLLEVAHMRNEIGVEEWLGLEPRTREEDKTLVMPEHVYNLMHPFDQWFVDLRCQFSTNWEAAAYLRLCGVSDLELDRAARRICNATYAKGDYKQSTHAPTFRRLDATLKSCKLKEQTLTKDDIATIVGGHFEYRQPRRKWKTGRMRIEATASKVK